MDEEAAAAAEVVALTYGIVPAVDIAAELASTCWRRLACKHGRDHLNFLTLDRMMDVSMNATSNTTQAKHMPTLRAQGKMLLTMMHRRMCSILEQCLCAVFLSIIRMHEHKPA